MPSTGQLYLSAASDGGGSKTFVDLAEAQGAPDDSYATSIDGGSGTSILAGTFGAPSTAIPANAVITGYTFRVRCLLFAGSGSATLNWSIDGTAIYSGIAIPSSFTIRTAGSSSSFAALAAGSVLTIANINAGTASFSGANAINCIATLDDAGIDSVSVEVHYQAGNRKRKMVRRLRHAIG